MMFKFQIQINFFIYRAHNYKHVYKMSKTASFEYNQYLWKSYEATWISMYSVAFVFHK